jgi:positive regulator of sigma E activity
MHGECLSVIGRVVDIDDSIEPGTILVEPQLACAGCRGCFWRAARTIRVAAGKPEPFGKGDQVTLTLPSTLVVSSALSLYALPLSALAGGTLLGKAFDPTGDLGPMLGALCGLGLAAVALLQMRTRLERKIRERLVIERSR